MKKYVLFFIISFLGANLFSQTFNLDSIRFLAMQSKDTLLLKRVLHDSLCYIHSNGLRETKNDFIKSIMSGKIQYDDFHILDRKRQVHNSTRHFYRGTIRVKGKYEGEVFQLKLAFVSSYQRQGKILKLIYWQSTRLKD